MVLLHKVLKTFKGFSLKVGGWGYYNLKKKILKIRGQMVETWKKNFLYWIFVWPLLNFMGFESQKSSLIIKSPSIHMLSSLLSLFSCQFITTATYVDSQLLASLLACLGPWIFPHNTFQFQFSKTPVFKSLPCCLWFKVWIWPPRVQGCLQSGY